MISSSQFRQKLQTIKTYTIAVYFKCCENWIVFSLFMKEVKMWSSKFFLEFLFIEKENEN